MKARDLKSINNLSLRYQDYDNAGTKYAYDIRYTTIHSDGESVKAKRQRGADNFCQHIKDLSENYDGVATITVSDYSGTAQNARMINPPITIELIDVQTVGRMPQVIIRRDGQSEKTENPAIDVLQGLSGLFSQTEYAGLGNLAPIAKFIDDKHTIDRLHEKCDEQAIHLTELERKNTELAGKYQSLTADYERLEDEADDMDDELEHYRRREQKQGNVMNMVGLAGASIAKTFLRQNPNILSGILPAEQLSGMLSDEINNMETVVVNELSDEEQELLDKATSVFEWLQTLEKSVFDDVFSIISVIRQQPAYAAHIAHSLSGNRKNGNDDNE